MDCHNNKNPNVELISRVCVDVRNVILFLFLLCARNVIERKRTKQVGRLFVLNDFLTD